MGFSGPVIVIAMSAATLQNEPPTAADEAADAPADPQPFADERDLSKVDGFLDTIERPLERWFRPVVRGMERIPSGSALMVANHNGGILMPDLWMLGAAMRKARGSAQLPYALVHDAALDAPVVGPALRALGAVRASHDGADALFRAGKKVLVFPGGDLENLRPFAHRDRIVFGPRRGYIRLAIRHGVPIAPVVTSGAHSGMLVLDDGQKIARALGFTKLRIHVCPTVLTIPWGVTIGFPPPYLPLPVRTYIEALAPITFARRGAAAAADEAYVERCHQEVVRRMQAALSRLSAERRAARRERIDEVIDGWLDRALGLLAPAIDPKTPAPALPADIGEASPRPRPRLVRPIRAAA
jgi:1-acyl-sn-glycerol-3-phosphate acyltransferase